LTKSRSKVLFCFTDLSSKFGALLVVAVQSFWAVVAIIFSIEQFEAILQALLYFVGSRGAPPCEDATFRQRLRKLQS